MTKRWTRPRFFVGMDNSIIENHRYKREVFKSTFQPTQQTHGHKYALCWGPFNSKRSAVWFVEYGFGNPHIQTTDDCDKFAKPN